MLRSAPVATTLPLVCHAVALTQRIMRAVKSPSLRVKRIAHAAEATERSAVASAVARDVASAVALALALALASAV